ncbi:MAG: hypothetical protein J5626_07755, partial [Lachnospiraceae bacterium]|nr:hypothetical protein [Lachnospiraceae bacterium]
MLKNKKVVKALTIGLATMMATPSMTVFAQVEGENSDSVAQPTTVSATPIDASAAEKVVVPVESTNEQQIEDAQNALKEARKEEQDVVNKTPALNPFDGMPDAALIAIDYNEANNFPGNDSAKEFDKAASNDLKEAQDILDEGASAVVEGEYDEEGEKVRRGLNDVNENIQEARDESQKANTAALNAAAELLNVDDAKKAADAAQNSDAAKVQAGLAKTASDNAEKYAKEAEGEAKKAQDAYEEAQKALEDAEKIAEKYNAEADAAIAEGAEDAAAAVKRAAEAKRIADGLQKEMETYHGEALKYEENVKTELGKAQKTLGDLIKNGKTLQKNWNEKHKAYDEATENWRDMFDAVVEAEKAVNSKNATVQDLKKQISDLEEALKKANKELGKLQANVTKAENELKTPKSEANSAAKELIDAINDNNDITETTIALAENQEALKAAEDAVQAIEAALENAKTKQEEASGKITELDGNIKAITDKYGDISKDQDTVLSDKPEDADKKAGAIANIIGKVAGGKDAAAATPMENLSDALKEAFPNGLFTANGTVYTYAVEDGVISVIECKDDLIPTLVDKTTTIEGLSDTALENAVAHLIDGTYEITPVTVPDEVTGYNISYTEPASTVQRGNNSSYDKKGQTGTFQYYNSIVYNVKYVSGKNGSGWKYEYKSGKWDWLPKNYWGMIQVSIPEQQVEKEITVDELSQYQNKQNFSSTEIKSDDVTTYTLVKKVIKSDSFTDKDSDEYKNR